MSTCEKCWRDAHRGPQFSVADEYAQLLRERRESPCTPEERAGPSAGICLICGAATLHQTTGEPMCGHYVQDALKCRELEAERDAALQTNVHDEGSIHRLEAEVLEWQNAAASNGADFDRVHAENEALRQKASELDRAHRFIESEGYRRCDIPACNCGSWHGGNAYIRLSEIADVLEDRTQGTTILDAVKALLQKVADAEWFAYSGKWIPALYSKDTEEFWQIIHAAREARED